MQSILVKTLLWSLATMALCVVSLWATAWALDLTRPRNVDFIRGLMAMVEEDACRALDDGGSQGLAAHLRALDAKLPGERFVTDATGRDLADGSDRSGLLRSAGEVPTRLPDGRFLVVTRPRNGQYRFLWIIAPWFDSSGAVPFIAVVVGIIAFMGTALAVHLSAPLRRLRQTMDRFGRGDLTARVGSRRRDEIGEVSRAFDVLAERLETLVTAERRLLQDVSHELRSPLTRLDVAIDLAIKRDDRGPLLARIRSDVTRLSSLVGELLQLTRAEGDPSARVLEDVRLDELVRHLADGCALEAEARGCRLELHVDSPMIVRGDSELLHRAVENVLRNAIRHAPEGSPIAVSLERRDSGARIVVRDLGAGVPPALLSSIFEPFFRVEGDRSRESGGIGLGLAIARRAVGLHQGQITARNAEPGLAVEIVLPA